jgi:DNA repair exonuclease SbcCD nuclease subunit
MGLVSNEITYPYLVISDVHCHNWSAFAYTNDRGINNRLQHILDGIDLAAKHLVDVGGRDLICTGDLFHTRGVIKPSVFNPTFDLFSDLSARGITNHHIPGNHDLEGIHCERLGSAMTSLAAIPNFYVYDKPTLVGQHLFIPWFEDSQKIPKLANERSKTNPNLTLFCHVGLNDVVPGAIGNTVDPDDFSEDFKYVFCGHFHNHVSFHSRVYSVGALTHQTWNDVGSKAGYLIVYEDRVEHYETQAPKFIDAIDAMICLHDVPGNYYRLKGELTDDQANTIIRDLKERRCLAVLDQSTRPSIIEKTYEHTVDIDLGLDSALEAYCKNTFNDNWKAVYEECLRLKS